MAYLIIIVVVGLIGITRLWLAQRREASQLDTIEGFSSALQKISPDTPLPAPKEAAGRRSWMRRGTRKAVPRRTRTAAPRGARRARKVASQRAHTQPARRRRPAPRRANPQVARRRGAAHQPRRRRRRAGAVRATNVQALDRRRRYEARRRIEARRRSQAS